MKKYILRSYCKGILDKRYASPLFTNIIWKFESTHECCAEKLNLQHPSGKVVFQNLNRVDESIFCSRS